MKLENFENSIVDCNIRCFSSDDNDIYFSGKDVVNYLQYATTAQAIHFLLDDDEKVN